MNNALVNFDVSPYHISFRTEISKLMNVALAFFASARAISVFPQPGGPCNNIPDKHNSNIM